MAIFVTFVKFCRLSYESAKKLHFVIFSVFCVLFMYAAQYIRIYMRFLNPLVEIPAKAFFLSDNKRIKQKMEISTGEIKYYRKVTKEVRNSYK